MAAVKGSLETAVAFEYVDEADIVEARAIADRICAMTYRLSR